MDRQVLDFEEVIAARQSLGTNSRPLQAILPGCIEVEEV